MNLQPLSNTGPGQITACLQFRVNCFISKTRELIPMLTFCLHEEVWGTGRVQGAPEVHGRVGGKTQWAAQTHVCLPAPIPLPTGQRLKAAPGTVAKGRKWQREKVGMSSGSLLHRSVTRKLRGNLLLFFFPPSNYWKMFLTHFSIELQTTRLEEAGL